MEEQSSCKEGRIVCWSLRRNNRTQLLLCRPPHPAERGSICCCCWPSRRWQKKWEKGEVEVVAADSGWLKVKKREWKVAKEMKRGCCIASGLSVLRERVWSKVCYLGRVLRMPLLCLITPRLGRLWKHSQGDMTSAGTWTLTPFPRELL